MKNKQRSESAEINTKPSVNIKIINTRIANAF